MKQCFWPVDLCHLELVGSCSALVLGLPLPSGAVVVVNVVPYKDAEELVANGVLRQRTRGTVALTETISNADIIGFFGEAPQFLKSPLPLLRFSVNANNTPSSPSTSIILFHPPVPKSMQFYTTAPITISLSQAQKNELNVNLVKLIKGHGSVRPLDPQEDHFATSIDTLNMCWTERLHLIREIPDMPRFWDVSSLLSPFMARFQAIYDSLITIYVTVLLKPLTTAVLYAAIFIRHICLFIITLLNTKISTGLPSLIELSATAQQIDLRLQQFCYFPVQYIRTTRLAESDHTGTMRLPKNKYAEYIRFYNTLWLIVNDFTLGFMVGKILLDNEERIASFFDKFVVQRVLYSELNNISVWLMNSPGGIKLNNELSMFLSDLFRWILEFWRISLIDPITPHYHTIVGIISFSSVFGATFSIALFTDFLSIITFHIYCFYIASARIYNWQLNILWSLFQLFCGKKRNVLRNRVDSNDYELDQLLMGTLLFTVNIFLLPTVSAFYVMFSTTELIILMITGCLELLTTLLNHFPLFILLLRFKNYKRLPGGIRFGNDRGLLRVYIKPLSISEMFAPFTNVMQKMNSLYLSPAMIKGILTGHTVQIQRNKFYKLLYSALPSTRISTSQLLAEMKNTL